MLVWLSYTACVALAVAGLSCLANWLDKWTVAHFTVLNDLEDLKFERKDGRKLNDTAVICGGSIAGLLAARVCSSHFEDVLIIDPDNDQLVTEARRALPSQPEESFNEEFGRQARPRVSQNNIIHINQVLNFMALELFFPDFRAWLKALRVPFGPAERLGYLDGALIPLPRECYPKGTMPDVFSMTRGAYETLLRGLVAKIPNVRFVKGIVTGITSSSEDIRRVESVSYRKGVDSTEIAVQTARLVIDCSGATHAGSTWLKRAGFSLPPTETYNPHMRYGTTEFSVDPAVMNKIIPTGFDSSTSYITVLINKLDRENKMLAINQIEGNRIHIVAGGWAFKGNVGKVAELRELVSSLRQTKPPPQWLYDLFDYLEGEPEKTSKQAMASSGALYNIKYQDKSQQLPYNFVALGDAVIKLNPVFGQGLTKAMIGAIVLNSCLIHESGDISAQFATRFFKMHTTKLKSTWNGTKCADYALNTTEPAQGETLASGAALRWLLQKVDDLQIAGDGDVARRRFEIVNWIAPPTTILAPSVLIKVVWFTLRQFWSPPRTKAA